MLDNFLSMEKLPLTTAYLRRGFSYILIFVWATLIFHEAITWKQILGIAVITVGMVISISDEKSAGKDTENIAAAAAAAGKDTGSAVASAAADAGKDTENIAAAVTGRTNNDGGSYEQ